VTWANVGVPTCSKNVYILMYLKRLFHMKLPTNIHLFELTAGLNEIGPNQEFI
jgi:hypothetical protein